MSYDMEGTTVDCYDGTTCLKNKFNIHNNKQLSSLEATITTNNISNFQNSDLPAKVDAEYYCSLHYQIFNDLYDWAGKYRTIDISKKGTVFAKAKDISQLMDNAFNRLNNYSCFVNKDFDSFIDNITDFYDTLNMIHPFREGNGRTERVFISQLIHHCGYEIDFSKIDNDLLMISTIHASQGVTDHLRDFFRNNIHPIQNQTKDIDFSMDW